MFNFVTVACNVYVGLGPWALRTLVYGAGLYSAIQGELIHASVHVGESPWVVVVGRCSLKNTGLTQKTNMITKDGIECEVFFCHNTKGTQKYKPLLPPGNEIR